MIETSSMAVAMMFDAAEVVSAGTGADVVVLSASERVEEGEFAVHECAAEVFGSDGLDPDGGSAGGL